MPIDQASEPLPNKNSEPAGPLTLSVSSNVRDVLSDWTELERLGLPSLYQRHEWITAWNEELNSSSHLSPAFVLGERDNKTLFLLPLGIRRLGPATLVEWLADSHSNYQTGLFSPEFIAASGATTMQDLLNDISSKFGGVDLFSLRCQPTKLAGERNPMTHLRHYTSSNPAFTLDLTGGFSAALDRIGGARRRKKYRKQINRIGGEEHVALRVAQTPQDVEEMLDEAFQHIEQRFRKLGIFNVFEEPGAQSFFKRLATQSLTLQEPLLRVFALEIDGKMRASLSGGVAAGQFSGCFLSLSEDDYAQYSPGDLLLYKVAEHCAKQGLTSFDLGRGEERYKLSWTNRTVDMIDVVVPMTALGHSLAALQRGKSEAKRLVRNNQSLWQVAKKVRAGLRRAV
ncbi:MAG: GNAT family N-acetyltransferase [Ahrensia sp.]|nr:GNAT family N-acetyltransferase [Ahrensia sp.]